MVLGLFVHVYVYISVEIWSWFNHYAVNVVFVGEMIDSVTDSIQRPIQSATYDLFYDNGVLIIPRHDESKVLVYKTL